MLQAAYARNARRLRATGNNDVMTVSSIMRWGNYDTVTGAVRWCGNSSSPTGLRLAASTSEVPMRCRTRPQPPVRQPVRESVPTTTTLPNSFFLTGAAATTATIPCGSGLSFNRTRPARRANPSLTTARTSRRRLGNLRQRRLSGQRVRVGSNQCGAGIACTQAMAGHANLNPRTVASSMSWEGRGRIRERTSLMHKLLRQRSFDSSRSSNSVVNN